MQAASLTTTGGGTTQLEGNIITTGTEGQSYGDKVLIGNNLTLNSNNANVNFEDTVDSQSSSTNTLGVDAGEGNIEATIIGGETALRGLELRANEIAIVGIGNSGTEGVSGNTQLTAEEINFTGATYNANQQTYTASHLINVNSIGLTSFTSSNDDISFEGNVNLAQNIKVDTDSGDDTDSGNGNIHFQTITGAGKNIELLAGMGNINLDGVVGSSENPVGNLTITSGNDVTAADITAASITQNSGTGITSFNGSVETSAGGINLTGNSFNLQGTINTTGGGLTIKNSGQLTLNSGADMNLEGAFVQQGTGTVSTGANIEITTENAAITFKGSGTVTQTEEITLNAGNGTISLKSWNAGNNPLNLVADEMDFLGGDNSVVGQNSLTLKPATPDLDIAIAGAEGTAALDLTTNDLNALANGFNQITIGHAQGTGAITIENSVEFKDPVTIQSPIASDATDEFGPIKGSITVEGNIQGSDDASIDLVAPRINLNADITTANKNITLGETDPLAAESANVLLGISEVSISTGLGSGDITFNANVNGVDDNKHGLQVQPGTGQVLFNGEYNWMQLITSQRLILPQPKEILISPVQQVISIAVTVRLQQLRV
ncbi:hypothetical protein [Coleofasciculus chthonoplastes]|uniref:hypothetical protein n=1 Tax=Coleofasciculus chthonoplastes TaxID=64178 RepID=UPI0032F14BEB